MEHWKPIAGYEELYEVSDLGRVRSLKAGRCLKPQAAGLGYKKVELYRTGKRKSVFVHRLVAKAFVPNPSKFLEVNHIDEDKSNNAASNLEWCSRKYNVNYGTCQARRAAAKSIPVNQYDKFGNLIQMFKSLYDADRLLGVSYTSISKCCKGKLKSAGGYIWRYT